jgi:NDP-sugar pyrophosphorylase family protein
MRYIDYGLSAFQRDAIRDHVPPGQRVDLADVFQSLSRDGRLEGFAVTKRFYEIGSPRGLAEFEQYVSQAVGVEV